MVQKSMILEILQLTPFFRYFKMIIVEPIKLKELTNDSKDKENLSVFQKYFKNILIVKSIN